MSGPTRARRGQCGSLFRASESGSSEQVIGAQWLSVSDWCARRGACSCSCAQTATYICTERGAVYCFGDNINKKLGLGECHLLQHEVLNRVLRTTVDDPQIPQEDVICNPMFLHQPLQHTICGVHDTVHLSRYMSTLDGASIRQVKQQTVPTKCLHVMVAAGGLWRCPCSGAYRVLHE